MICRDFMIRICHKKLCTRDHEVKKCTDASCNRNALCKLVHFTTYEVLEINENVRPFRYTVYNELKRLAFILRKSFPLELRTHTCTLYMLGECVWPCLTCGTASHNISNVPVCNRCFVVLTEDMQALLCGHVYCTYCMERLPLQTDGPLPINHCMKCEKWAVPFILYGVNGKKSK